MRRWTLVVWLVGCGGPEWSDDRVMAPHLEALDPNGDGRVDAEEYARTRWNGPPFATADIDGDGTLGATELARLVRVQSAGHFDGGGHAPVKLAEGMGSKRPTAVQHRVEAVAWKHTALQAAGEPGLTRSQEDALLAVVSEDSPALVEAEAAVEAAWSGLQR